MRFSNTRPGDFAIACVTVLEDGLENSRLRNSRLDSDPPTSHYCGSNSEFKTIQHFLVEAREGQLRLREENDFSERYSSFSSMEGLIDHYSSVLQFPLISEISKEP